MKTYSHKSRLYLKEKKQPDYLLKIFGPNPWYFIITITAAIITVTGIAYLLGVMFSYMM